MFLLYIVGSLYLILSVAISKGILDMDIYSQVIGTDAMLRVLAGRFYKEFVSTRAIKDLA